MMKRTYITQASNKMLNEWTLPKMLKVAKQEENIRKARQSFYTGGFPHEKEGQDGQSPAGSISKNSQIRAYGSTRPSAVLTNQRKVEVSGF